MATSIDKKLKVTRDQLSKFIDDPNTVKQFENLFAYINGLIILVEEDLPYIPDAFSIPITYDLSSADAIVDFPEISGDYQAIFFKWENGGTYKLTCATPDGALIDGLSAGTWQGEGEGRMKAVSNGTGWDVEVYEDSGAITDSGESTGRRFVKTINNEMRISGRAAFTGISCTTAVTGVGYRTPGGLMLITYGKSFAAIPERLVPIQRTLSTINTVRITTSETVAIGSILSFCNSSQTGLAIGIDWEAIGPWHA